MKLFVKAGGSRNKENIVFGTMSTIMKFLTSRDSNLGELGGLANMVSYFWGIAFLTTFWKSCRFHSLEIIILCYPRA